MLFRSDTELAAHLHPPLTSVRTDAYAWGQSAAGALLTQLAGGPTSDIHLPAASFVLRESTAPPP